MEIGGGGGGFRSLSFPPMETRQAAPPYITMGLELICHYFKASWLGVNVN